MEQRAIDKSVFAASYLPPISWWRKWVRAGMPQLCRTVPFSRHTNLNRTTIDSPNGPLSITVPIQKPQMPHPTMADICISGHGDWRHKHWHALESSYSGTPYFEYYADDFLTTYNADHTHLADLNEQLIHLVATLAGLADPHLCAALDAQQIAARTDDYYQMFAHRHGFLSNLSIVDLLFNMGPESIYWIV